MSKRVDVSIAFYGKPYQTIVTIKTLMQHSGRHIDKIILSRERRQPHEDYIGVFKIIDYFRNDPEVNLEVQYPRYQLGAGVEGIERAKSDTAWRHSVLYQYAFETTDKKYLCITHNDMLYHRDIIGEMLKKMESGPDNLIGVGSVGQCWSCPAGVDWAGKCNGTKYTSYVPSKEEALELTAAFATPRRERQLKVIGEGRVHPLPECRLNEFCSLMDVEKYRKETIPNGDIGCFGGNWGGTDTGTVWSHDIYQKGYYFEHLTLEEYSKHAPFDDTGSGTGSYSRSDLYWIAEKRAEDYIVKNFGPIRFSGYVKRASLIDDLKRNTWLAIIHTFGFLKKLIGKG